MGVSGLIYAYKLAAAEALQHSTIIKKTVNEVNEISFDYIAMNDVMKIIKEEQLTIIHQQSELDCIIRFSVRKSNSNKVYDLLSKINKLKIKFIETV